MKVTVEFNNSSEEDNVENIINRFLSDYPNSTHEKKEEILDGISVYFKDIEWLSIDDVDTFLCEEICHEYEMYCFIFDDVNRKEYYYDEEDYWYDK
jgi:hypothetical protein